MKGGSKVRRWKAEHWDCCRIVWKVRIFQTSLLVLLTQKHTAIKVYSVWRSFIRRIVFDPNHHLMKERVYFPPFNRWSGGRGLGVCQNQIFRKPVIHLKPLIYNFSSCACFRWPLKLSNSNTPTPHLKRQLDERTKHSRTIHICGDSVIQSSWVSSKQPGPL